MSLWLLGNLHLIHEYVVFVCSDPLLDDISLNNDDGNLSTEVKMAEDIKAKLKNYRTAPFDARFPNTNQTRNCWANYMGKCVSQGHISKSSSIVYFTTLKH